MMGVRQLARANNATFAKLSVAPRVHELARQLNVDVLDEAAIHSAEEDLGIDANHWIGFHDPEFGERVVKSARSQLNSVKELQNVGKYLFGSFWFTDDFTRIKQLRRAAQLLVKAEDLLFSAPLQLGIGEVVSLLTLTAYSIAARQKQLSTSDFRELVIRELSTGLGDPRGLRLLLRRFDEFHREQIEDLHDTYQSTGTARIVFPITSLEESILTPPEWVDAFIELVIQIGRKPHLATDTIRLVDLWSAKLLGAEIPSDQITQIFEAREAVLTDNLAIVLAFLTRHWKVPADYFAMPNPTMGLGSTPDENASGYTDPTSGIAATITTKASSQELNAQLSDNDSGKQTIYDQKISDDDQQIKADNRDIPGLDT